MPDTSARYRGASPPLLGQRLHPHRTTRVVRVALLFQSLLAECLEGRPWMAAQAGEVAIYKTGTTQIRRIDAMGAQENYNTEVVQQARRLVSAAGLDKLPLVMALRQISVALEIVGPERALKILDRLSIDERVDDAVIQQILSTPDDDVLAGRWWSGCYGISRAASATLQSVMLCQAASICVRKSLMSLRRLSKSLAPFCKSA